jgi:UDP-glucose 4-epimerase
VFNCGYGKGYSVLEVVNAVEKACGHKMDVRMAERRAGDPAEIVANADKARATLGWQPKHADLDLIVKTALDWEKHLQIRNG